MPQMIIANRLRDGVVVFLAPDEGWVPAIAAGTLIEVELEQGQPRPTAIREAIRAFGPSVRTDLTEV